MNLKKMMLENLVKGAKKMVRNAALVSAVALPIACAQMEKAACNSKDFYSIEKPNGEIAQVLDCGENQIPKVEIGRNFGDGLSGKVTYLLNAKDDEKIQNLYFRVGNGPIDTYPNGTALQVPITAGTNHVELYAVDKKGKKSKVVSNDFYSPTEAEAWEEMEKALKLRGDTYVLNVGLTNGTDTIVGRVDCAVDDETDPNGFYVINFVSHSDDKTQAEADRQTEIDYGIKNHDFVYLPLEEIAKRITQISQ